MEFFLPNLWHPITNFSLCRGLPMFHNHNTTGKKEEEDEKKRGGKHISGEYCKMILMGGFEPVYIRIKYLVPLLKVLELIHTD
jgi:hypothetical protein